jgi:hypothetical protein
MQIAVKCMLSQQTRRECSTAVVVIAGAFENYCYTLRFTLSLVNVNLSLGFSLCVRVWSVPDVAEQERCRTVSANA